MGVQSLGQEDPLAEEMAVDSSILAQKIPWIKETGRLQFMGSQRIGHDQACAHTHTHDYQFISIIQDSDVQYSS